MAFLSVFDVPTRAPSIPKAPPACQAAKSTAGQAVPPPATVGAVSGVPVAGIQQTTIHTFMVNRGTETHVFIHTYGGRKSPVSCTVPQYCHCASTSHTKTQSNNQCKVGFMLGSFCTVLTTRGSGVLSQERAITRPVGDNQRGRSCTSPLRIIVSPRKLSKMPPIQPVLEGAKPWSHTFFITNLPCWHSHGSS